MQFPFTSRDHNREYYLSQLHLLIDDLRQEREALEELERNTDQYTLQTQIVLNLQRVIIWVQGKIES